MMWKRGLAVADFKLSLKEAIAIAAIIFGAGGAYYKIQARLDSIDQAVADNKAAITEAHKNETPFDELLNEIRRMSAALDRPAPK